MTQLAIPDQLAERITAAAESCGTTPASLLDKIFTDIMETDEAFATRMLTPELGQRIVQDLAEVDKSNYTTSEEVDAIFEKFFDGIKSR
jgi:hypothetical protein